MGRFSVFCVMVILFASIEIAAQVAPGNQRNFPGDASGAQKQKRESVENQRWNDEVSKRADGLDLGETDASEEAIRRKLRAKESLQPEKKYRKMFEGILKQSNTGLIKISGPKDCRVVELENSKSNDPCAASVLAGGGKAFSFRHREHSSFADSDLQRNGNDLVVQGSFAFGLITSLDDVPFESVSLQTKAVISALQFNFSPLIDDIDRQEKELFDGMKINGVTFTSQLPIMQNTTYLMRSIACQAVVKSVAGSKSKQIFRNDKKRFDVVVAFRIIDIHGDGSLTMIWKEINRQDSPTIELEQES